jgi:hypothetical protein
MASRLACLRVRPYWACRRSRCFARALRHGYLCHRSALQPLSRAACRRARGRREHPLPLGTTPVSICRPAKQPAPAFSPLAVWQVDQEGDRIFVRRKGQRPKSRGRRPVDAPDKIVIVGGGAAGLAAAEMLRRQAFPGNIVMFGRRYSPASRSTEPVKGLSRWQRPGEWLPLGPGSFYVNAVSICSPIQRPS